MQQIADRTFLTYISRTVLVRNGLLMLIIDASDRPVLHGIREYVFSAQSTIFTMQENSSASTNSTNVHSSWRTVHTGILTAGLFVFISVLASYPFDQTSNKVGYVVEGLPEVERVTDRCHYGAIISIHRTETVTSFSSRRCAMEKNGQATDMNCQVSCGYFEIQRRLLSCCYELEKIPQERCKAFRNVLGQCLIPICNELFLCVHDTWDSLSLHYIDNPSDFLKVSFSLKIRRLIAVRESERPRFHVAKQNEPNYSSSGGGGIVAVTDMVDLCTRTFEKESSDEFTGDSFLASIDKQLSRPLNRRALVSQHGSSNEPKVGEC
ncbi:unnamed protein product [Soboliphyme baturini]|uniref:Apple domain-containing protein n=1 Tax=Soboliphyme baturini TaxID=241478 RepID=A0A183IPY3_9BILA|nr:unnamed protein product [Soboliphyme baturini]